MNTKAVERTSNWAYEAVVLLIRVLVDEKILQQLDICSKKTDLGDGKTMDTSRPVGTGGGAGGLQPPNNLLVFVP